MHHGLQHPPAQLAALPVLDAQSTQPIRALDAQTFAQLHLQHTLAHPPDNVLFPFLHGLEGDNQAQNTFFATSSFPGGAGSRHHGHHQGPHRRITPRVPAYRGLVWVVCEEDLERAGDAVSLRVLRRRPSRVSADSSLEGAVPSSGSEDDDDEYAYGGYSEWDGEGESDDSGMDEELDEDDQDIMLLDALAHGNDSHRHSSLGVSPLTSELDLQCSSMSSVSPASPASPPLNILQTPLPPPHPDIITIASSDSFSHSNPHDHTQSPSGSPSSPSTLSDLGLVGLNMDNSGMAITLPDDMKLLPGGIGKKDAASYEGVHMHPVAHRPSLLPTPETATKTSSTPSSTSASASASQSSSDLSVPGDVEASESRASPAQTQLKLQPPLSNQLDAAEQSRLQRQFEAQVQLGQIEGPPARPRPPRRPDTNPAAPPLLTSTFRPKELLRRRRPPTQAQGGVGPSPSLPTSVASKLNGSSPARPCQAGGKEDEGWEFVPARVPDGISLRNFGIQVSTQTERSATFGLFAHSHATCMV
ncbi:hypothetical protein HYPSUDRAFT_293082 [Hypholoma sublateritium FD-334 SS-4]|uniref:Uncharacterized protein n=1 Tax=Hypholoma sublateritium (strain FD-334 SS-4) TaxID=945553 RepID=A0A0D2LZT9_HYPSF|nr:hypothetical protein HYPSUDRAFT_293082 [Hypholoma sublateritium FD-334 SS-4]